MQIHLKIISLSEMLTQDDGSFSSTWQQLYLREMRLQIVGITSTWWNLSANDIYQGRSALCDSYESHFLRAKSHPCPQGLLACGERKASVEIRVQEAKTKTESKWEKR